MLITKEVILGSTPAYPLPGNTFATAYTADSSTRLIIVNAKNPADVSITSTLVDGRTVLSIVPVMRTEINVTEDSVIERQIEVVEVMPNPIPSGLVYAFFPLFLAYDNPDGIKNLINWDIEPLLRK